MRVKALSRDPYSYLPARKGDQPRLPRNYDPALHPFEKAREYTRALNAVKLERMFAAPFLRQLGRGHVDGVYTLIKNPFNLATCVSGSGDGEIKVWNVPESAAIFSIRAHEGIVRGLTLTPSGKVLSCSSDRTIKLWDLTDHNAVKVYTSLYGINSISHHRADPLFATASSSIAIYDHTRSESVSNMTWGAESIQVVRFNQTERSVLLAAGSDRTLILYDLRTSSPTTKLITKMRTNSVSWNPMEAFNFATASEDHNLYMFDMRKLDSALNVYKDHVSAVLDVDFAPTGEELVSGSYDRTIRLWRREDGRSRDVYHTTRMQRVFAVQFSMDSRYIFSGSDDGNVRLWRAQASSRAGVQSLRQREQQEYADALKRRFSHMPEIKRISKSRNLPKPIKNASAIKRIEETSLKRREENRRRHSKPGTVERVAERRAVVIAKE